MPVIKDTVNFNPLITADTNKGENEAIKRNYKNEQRAILSTERFKQSIYNCLKNVYKRSLIGFFVYYFEFDIRTAD